MRRFFDYYRQFAAFGDIVDGSYRLTTHTTGDGAVPGRYRVTITSAEAVTRRRSPSRS